MTELEEKVIRKFVDDATIKFFGVDDGTIKFYGRYVDDTLLVMKPNDIERLHQALNI